MKKNIKIVIADDHQIIHDGLRSLLQSTSQSFELVGGVRNGSELLQLLQEKEVDLAIVDISMEKINGIEATKIIKRDYPHIKILILSMHAEKAFILSALKAGADGYILKECAFEDLKMAILTIMSGNIFLSSTINNQIIREYLGNEKTITAKMDNSQLTSREYQILKLLADGLSIKEIAHELNLSPKTVDSHRQQIMIKLNLRSVADLIRYALKEGISSL